MKSFVVGARFGLFNGSNGHGGGFSLLAFFWRSSGFFWRSSGVILGSSVLSNARRTPEERQKNARRTPEEPRRTQKNPEEPRRTQKEKNTSPPANDISIGDDINGD